MQGIAYTHVVRTHSEVRLECMVTCQLGMRGRYCTDVCKLISVSRCLLSLLWPAPAAERVVDLFAGI